MARPFHQPDEHSRAMVTAMAINGVPHEEIAKAVPVSLPTLYRHYRAELDYGAVRANARVTDSLYRMAISGRYPAATIFWAKTRMRWVETEHVEHSGTVEVADLTDDERAERIAAILERARARRDQRAAGKG